MVDEIAAGLRRDHHARLQNSRRPQRFQSWFFQSFSALKIKFAKQ